MKLKTPMALSLLSAAAFAAEKKDTGIGGQIVEGFTSIPGGGLGMILAVVIIFVAAFAVGFFFGSR